VRELKELFRLGAAYGYSDWLVLDLTVVRYTYCGYTYYGYTYYGYTYYGQVRPLASFPSLPPLPLVR